MKINATDTEKSKKSKVYLNRVKNNTSKSTNITGKTTRIS